MNIWVIGLMGAAIVTLGSLYAAQIDTSATLRVSLTQQQREQQNTERLLNDLQSDYKRISEQLQRTEQERNNARLEYQRNARKLQDQLERQKQALQKHPERYSRVLSYTLYRRLRDICKRSGGTTEDCSIPGSTPRTTDTHTAD